MEVEIKEVSIDEKEILRNLQEKYDYEFSQWNKKDVNKLGLYGYDYLDYYWVEDKRHAFFIMVDGKLDLPSNISNSLCVYLIVLELAPMGE